MWHKPGLLLLLLLLPRELVVGIRERDAAAARVLAQRGPWWPGLGASER